MSNNNRIKLTNIIAKLPEEAIDTLYNTAFSLLDTFSIPDKPACPYCGQHPCCEEWAQMPEAGVPLQMLQENLCIHNKDPDG